MTRLQNSEDGFLIFVDGCYNDAGDMYDYN